MKEERCVTNTPPGRGRCGAIREMGVGPIGAKIAAFWDI
jgi:hypothetical protein